MTPLHLSQDHPQTLLLHFYSHSYFLTSILMIEGVLTSSSSWIVTYLYLREIRVADSCPNGTPVTSPLPSTSVPIPSSTSTYAGDVPPASTSTSSSLATISNPLLQHEGVEGGIKGYRVRSGLPADPGSGITLPLHPTSSTPPSHSEAAYDNVYGSGNGSSSDIEAIKVDDDDADRLSADSPNPAYARFTIEDSGSDVEDDPSHGTPPLPFSTSRQSDLLSAATRKLEQSDPAVPVPDPDPTAPAKTPQTGPFLYKETGPHFLEFEETPRSSRQGSDALAPKLSDKAVPPYFHPSPGASRKTLIASALVGSTGYAVPVAVSHSSLDQDNDIHCDARMFHHSHQGTGQPSAAEAEEQHHRDSSCTRQRDNSECELAHTRHRGASLWSYSGHDLGEEEVRVQMHGDAPQDLTSTSHNDYCEDNSKSINFDSHDRYNYSHTVDNCRQESKNNYYNNNNNDSQNSNSSSSQHEAHTQGGIQAFVPMPQTAWKTVSELISSRTFWRFSAFTLLLVNLKTVFRHLDATLPTYLVRMFGENVPKGIIYSINPFMIIFLTPLVSALTSTTAHFDMIKYGSYITAVSPFFLAASTSIWATVWYVPLPEPLPLPLSLPLSLPCQNIKVHVLSVDDSLDLTVFSWPHACYVSC